MAGIISLAVDVFFLYLAIGVVFSIWFVFAGAAKLDEGVPKAPWHFRLIILPGSILLWVPLFIKLLKHKS